MLPSAAVPAPEGRDQHGLLEAGGVDDAQLTGHLRVTSTGSARTRTPPQSGDEADGPGPHGRREGHVDRRATRAAGSGTGARRPPSGRAGGRAGPPRPAEHSRPLAVAVRARRGGGGTGARRPPSRGRGGRRRRAVPEAVDVGAVTGMRAGRCRQRAGDDETPHATASTSPSGRAISAPANARPRALPQASTATTMRRRARPARAGSGSTISGCRSSRSSAGRAAPARSCREKAAVQTAQRTTPGVLRARPSRARARSERAPRRGCRTRCRVSPTAGKNAPFWQPGQDSQARPEPVSRLPPP